jgi:hypothetical protein
LIRKTARAQFRGPGNRGTPVAITQKQEPLEELDMKKQILLISMMITAAVFSSSAFSKERAVTRIDFNKMIDENNVKKNELQKEETETAQQPKVKKDDKGKVIDFIDVEIGVGQTPSVTDRRFDSVGEAQIVDIHNLQNEEERGL